MSAIGSDFADAQKGGSSGHKSVGLGSFPTRVLTRSELHYLDHGYTCFRIRLAGCGWMAEASLCDVIACIQTSDRVKNGSAAQ